MSKTLETLLATLKVGAYLRANIRKKVLSIESPNGSIKREIQFSDRNKYRKELYAILYYVLYIQSNIIMKISNIFSQLKYSLFILHNINYEIENYWYWLLKSKQRFTIKYVKQTYTSILLDFFKHCIKFGLNFPEVIPSPFKYNERIFVLIVVPDPLEPGARCSSRPFLSMHVWLVMAKSFSQSSVQSIPW